MRPRVAQLGCVVLLLAAACSRTGTVTGEVSARLPDGRTQRAHRIEVMLVRDAPFHTQWGNLIAEFDRQVHNLSTAIERANADVKRYEAAAEGSRSARTAAESRRTAALARRQQAIESLKRIVADYERRALQTIQRSRGPSATTDVIGHFELRDVPPGRYFVYAAQPLDSDASIARWLVPLDVGQGPQTLMLSSANASWPFTASIPAD